jgi:hypothetical protein
LPFVGAEDEIKGNRGDKGDAGRACAADSAAGVDEGMYGPAMGEWSVGDRVKVSGVTMPRRGMEINQGCLWLSSGVEVIKPRLRLRLGALVVLVLLPQVKLQP